MAGQRKGLTIGAGGDLLRSQLLLPLTLLLLARSPTGDQGPGGSRLSWPSNGVQVPEIVDDSVLPGEFHLATSISLLGSWRTTLNVFRVNVFAAGGGHPSPFAAPGTTG